jgi:hypothetical protein
MMTMAIVSEKKAPKRVIGLDRHRLGLIGGSIGALVVLCLSFFYQQTDFYTAAIRTGWAFVVSYFAVAVLVHGILRATLIEVIQQRDRTDAKVPKEADTAEDPLDAATVQDTGGEV